MIGFYMNAKKVGKISAIASIPLFVAAISTISAIEAYKTTNIQTHVISNKQNNVNLVNTSQVSNNLQEITNFIENEPINLSVTNTEGTKYQWYLNNQPLKDNSEFSGVNTANLTINQPTLSLNNGVIYCQLTYSDGGIQNTNSTTLNYLSNFNISKAITTLNVSSNDVNEGSNFELSVVTDISLNYEKYLTYQWYLNNQKIPGANSSTYTVSNANPQNAGSYYCQISLNWNNKPIKTIESNQRKIEVLPNKDFTLGIGFKSNSAKYFPTSSNPYIFINSNEAFNLFTVPVVDNSFFIPNGTVTYQWFKNNEPLTDNNNIIGSDDSVFGEENPTWQDSGIYYCEATYQLKDGEFLKTKTIPLYISINDPNHIAICENINNKTVNEGQSVKFEVQGTYNQSLNNINYQWYVKKQGDSTFTKMPNQTNPILNLSPVEVENNNGSQFYCQLSYNNGTTPITSNSNIATLSVNQTKIDILNQPISISNALIGQNIQFSVNAIIDNDYNPSDLKYQWIQIIDKNNVKVLKDQIAPILNLNNINYSQNNSEYACYVYVNEPSLFNKGIYTNPIKLSILKPTLNSNALIQGESQVNVGQNDKLSVQASSNYLNLPSGYKYTYQWMSSIGDVHFQPLIGQNLAYLDLSNLNHQQKNYYQCLIKIENSDNQTIDSYLTPSFTLNVNDPIEANLSLPFVIDNLDSQPLSITPKTEVINDPTNEFKQAQYQWQYSQDDGKTWKDLVGQTESELHYEKIDNEINDVEFRLLAKVDGKTFYSNPCKINVVQKIAKVVINKQNINANIGSNQTLAVNVYNDQNQLVSPTEFNLKYQWYVNFNGKNELIKGANQELLNLNNVQSSWNNARFYCVVTYDNENYTSSNVNLNINPVQITYTKLNDSIDLSKTTDWNIALQNVQTNYNIANATLAYQWQYLDLKTNQWTNLNQTNSNLDLHSINDISNNELIRCVITYKNNSKIYAQVATNPEKIILQSTSDNPNVNNPNNPDKPNLPNTPGHHEPNNTNHGSSDGNSGNDSSSSSHNAWIAYPIVFGSLLGIVGVVGIVYYFIKSNKRH